jgi:hypothetical protein
MARVQFLAGARDFSLVSRLALGFTQPLIQWVPGVISLGIKRQVYVDDYSPLISAKVRNGEAILPLSINFHGVVLN